MNAPITAAMNEVLAKAEILFNKEMESTDFSTLRLTQQKLAIAKSTIEQLALFVDISGEYSETYRIPAEMKVQQIVTWIKKLDDVWG